MPRNKVRQMTAQMSLFEEAKVSMAEPEPMTGVGDQKSPTPFLPLKEESSVTRPEKRTDSDYKGSLRR